MFTILIFIFFLLCMFLECFLNTEVYVLEDILMHWFESLILYLNKVHCFCARTTKNNHQALRNRNAVSSIHVCSFSSVVAIDGIHSSAEVGSSQWFHASLHGSDTEKRPHHRIGRSIPERPCSDQAHVELQSGVC